ncbi:MAG: FtsK/SpoIIIE domain-containing protein, partial [Phycisphaeraceae bacterium]
GYAPVRDAMSTLGAAMLAEHRQVLEQGKTDRHEADERRRADRKAIEEKYRPRMEQLKQKEQTSRESIERRHRQQRESIDAQHTTQRGEVEQGYTQPSGAIESRYTRYREQLDARHARQRRAIEQEAETELATFQSRWRRGIDRLRALIDETAALGPEHTRPLNDPAWRDWQPDEQPRDMARYGSLHVDVRQLASTAARQGRYRVELPKAFETPAMLKLPQRGSLLIEHDHAGRERALATLQAAMARLLVALPPARARFTIVDPVGLGQNFAGFMHLADFDEKLVTSRIWTEGDQIERRLADLSEHMENVIQKYLRNEFETIDQYNAQAGELAEPYRFLVLADAPAGISEDAAKRLRSIVNSGARCGVYVLVAWDTTRTMPASLALKDLEAHCLTLRQIDEEDRDPETEPAFACLHPVYQHFPVTLDEPPDEHVLTTLVQKAGRAAQEAGVVEVPFEHIAPGEDKLWSADCTDELRVPIGRSGAVRQQELRFGKGVAQHALIAGKTGSGKSTLLHVLIANLALWYSPDEVQFYLVDFKKGVEFKTYARHDLPHAQVVAIESDREFGLSVLKRLDEELERRGEMFRKEGVQTLAEFRRKRPGDVLPRTLLIVDEFQELFTEDDKLAQDAAMLLDRLVRQGRAFGIHVILGSQTLGGSTGLGRGTMGQMAVRIALQCNEADSQLIFDDSNTAARLLSRPGEAIYNDAGGTMEGNNPFQVSWLSDAQREAALNRVTALARERGRHDEPTIVFEGAESADPRENHQLAQLLGRSDWPAAGEVETVAWMGQPVTIAPPSGVRLRRHHAANLLVVGQRDDAALAMLQTAMLSLATQQSPGEARFVVFDATPADHEQAALTRELVEGLPHDAYLVPWRETEAAMAELAAEMERRKAAAEAQQGEAGGDADPSVYAFILGLQRYRVFRKQEDTLGFSFGSADDDADAPATGQADKQLGELLQEGPPVGVHVLTWCDTLLSLERTFDRQTLREFDARVLLQMSGTDSSHLVDSPAASQLGFHRALLASDEAGTMEKFRPYKEPDATWLRDALTKLRQRTT